MYQNQLFPQTVVQSLHLRNQSFLQQSQFSVELLLDTLFSCLSEPKLFIVGSFFAPAVKSCKMIYISLNHYNIFFSKLY